MKVYAVILVAGLLSGAAIAQSSQTGAGGWTDLPNTWLQSVCPAQNFGAITYDWQFYCKGVVRAWSGAIADTSRNRMILWGGGHSDYDGNELYSLDLNTHTLTRLNDPTVPTSRSSGTTCTTSPLSSGEEVPLPTGGYPNARHTYAGLVYIPYADRMFAFGGSLAPCGEGSLDTWTLNLATLQWQKMNPVNGDDRE